MALILELQDAGFTRGDRMVFRGVSFGVEPGQILCVLGPNGIGKTTLLRCIAGLERLNKGMMRLDGHLLEQMTRRKVGQFVGLVPQSDAPGFSYTVQQMVEMGRAAHLGWLSAPGRPDHALAAAALERLGIAHLADRAYPELSGGERQLVLIARALTQQPQLLVLDEPTAHLDFAHQAEVLDLVQDLSRQGLGVVLTTHDPGHAFRVADTVLLMSRDLSVSSGNPALVLTEASLSAAYGRSIRLFMAEGQTVCMT